MGPRELLPECCCRSRTARAPESEFFCTLLTIASESEVVTGHNHVSEFVGADTGSESDGVAGATGNTT